MADPAPFASRSRPRSPRVKLWHVPISHYSEKARWALDFKRVPHVRRAVLAGTHPLVTFLLTRGEHQTVPVLTLDGRSVGDSTAIIAALESRFPQRPLYPTDADERHRALELEDWFDEQLGPHIRRWAYHELTSDPEALAELTYKQVPWARPATLAASSRAVTLFLDARFRVRSEERARRAEEKVMEALDRLEDELAGREFLCGDAFSIADLTAASLFYGLVLPPEGPWTPTRVPPAWIERTRALRGRPGYQWITQTYARHRLPGAVGAPAGRVPERSETSLTSS